MTAEASSSSAPSSGVMMVCTSCNATYDAEIEVCPADGSGLLEVPRAPLLTGTMLDGRYQVGSVIGSGGMGTVYRAYQPSMDRPVAIKVLHPQYAHEPRAVKRFFREAQSASRLLHPNIVTVYDFGRAPEGHLYMVMELVEGWTLGDLIYYRAPLEPPLCISVASQVCDALAEAHRRRTVHRDLKPDNVQLTTLGDRVYAKVLDFGIARVVRDSEARLDVALSTVDIAGTPAYMSPEQILGKDPDPRSDLYSLGVMLFEMLAGERPFADDSSMSLCMKQIHDPPPRVGTMARVKSVPRSLEALVATLLMKDPDLRPKSAEDAKRALMACPEAGQPVDFLAVLGDLPQAMAEMPTRADAGAMMALPTLDSGSAREIGGTGARLSEVLAKLELAVPAPRERTRACSTCGAPTPAEAAACERCGQTLRPAGRQAPQVTHQRVSFLPKPRPTLAVAHLVAQDPPALRRPEVVEWLCAREGAGWTVERGPVGVVLRVPDTGSAPQEALAAAAREIVALGEAAGAEPVPLKAGLCEVAPGEETRAADVARRLAATARPGSLAVPSALAQRLGLRGRPLTGMFLADGKPLECTSLGKGAPEGDRVARLRGRGPVLRRFAQIVEEARREGPIRVTLCGPAGIGKTATAHACVAAVPHLYLRVSPAAAAWPGHTLARLVRLALGLPDGRDAERLTARVETLPHRDRELLELVCLDRIPEERATAHEIASGLVHLLDERADGGPFALVLDDAHLIDPASAELLDGVMAQAAGRPWLLVTTRSDRQPSAPALSGIEHSIDLRPLGVRACIGVLETLDVETRRHLPLAGVSAGNPLALALIAALPPETPLPSPERAIAVLLPETLRQLEGKDAIEAWLDAALGADERDRRRVQAARRYLELGPPEPLRKWLADTLRQTGGVYADLASSWEAPRGSHLWWKAEREVRLGLWSQAEASYLAAAVLCPERRLLAELAAAEMRLLAGDAQGALERFEACLRSDPAGLPPAALCRFAAALQAQRCDDRAEELLGWLCARVTAPDEAPLAAEVHALLARAAARRGQGEEAQAALAGARDLVAGLRMRDARAARALEALCQEVRAELARAQGDAQGARTNLRQACDAFRDLARPSDALRCLVELGRIELDLGHLPRATDTFRAAVRLAAAAGLRTQLREARVGLGRALAAQGELEEGTQILRACLREASLDRGDAAALVEAALGLATVMLARGLEADAERYAQRALSAARHEAERGRCHRVLSQVRESAGHRRQASAHLEEARRAARRTGDGFFTGEAAERAGEAAAP